MSMYELTLVEDGVQDGFWHMGHYECDIGDELKEGLNLKVFGKMTLC